MAYLDSKRRPDFGSMAAVVAIHGAVGAALVFGLTVTGVIAPPDLPVPTFDVKKPVPPPPPDPVEDPVQPSAKSDPYVPVPPLPLPTSAPELDTTSYLPPPRPPIPQPGPGTGTIVDPPIPTPVPSFTAVGARPRNDPRRWVTEADYRPSWINREMTGRARFRLEIAADGRVTDCAITASSGHPELDAATCALVAKRARFQPARGGEGEPVAGSYVNAIDWRLPE